MSSSIALTAGRASMGIISLELLTKTGCRGRVECMTITRSVCIEESDIEYQCPSQIWPDYYGFRAMQRPSIKLWSRRKLGLTFPGNAGKLFADVISLIFLHFSSFLLPERVTINLWSWPTCSKDVSTIHISLGVPSTVSSFVSPLNFLFNQNKIDLERFPLAFLVS